MNQSSKLLSFNVEILKSKITKHAISGVIISVAAIIAATVLSSMMMYQKVDMTSLINTQKSNPILWILDLMPIVFAFWGQSVGMKMAYEMGALIVDQTEELRVKTSMLESKVTREATHDALTDLPNRILFKDRIEHAIKISNRQKSKFTIFVLDLDRFKEINNTLGHFNGDLLLKQVASRLTGIVRDSDTLARIGGDEYGMLFPAIKDKEDIQVVAEKIVNAFNPAFVLEGMNLDVRASTGAVIFPEHGEDADTLLQRVDVAMYMAKQENKSFVIYDPEMDKNSPYRLTLMSELKKAIMDDDLVLYYQPKIDAMENRLIGVESLVRWRHKIHGLIMPEEFIGLAERTGLIEQLTRWVMGRAFQQALIWHKSGINTGMSLNLSTKNLLDPELPDIIAGLLASYPVPPESMVFEITETSIMADPDRAREVLSRINQMGVNFSIDDFGTGYSSLSYLTKLPVREIKIDKSFIADMLENANNLIIVRTTIDMAHNLGLKVTAEGVENEETYEKLKSLGCDAVQGYYFSEPVDANHFEDLLQSAQWASGFDPGKPDFMNQPAQRL
jgi:diguanylate cyclase